MGVKFPVGASLDLDALADALWLLLEPRVMASLTGQKSTAPPLANPDVTAPAVPPQPTLLYQSGLNYLLGWPHSVDPVVPGAITSGTKDYTVSLSGVAQAPPISDTAVLGAPTLAIIGTNSGGALVTGSDNGSVLSETTTTGDANAQHFGTLDEFVYVPSIARGPVVVALHITAETLVGAFSKRGVEMRGSLNANDAYYNFFSFGAPNGLKGEQRASAGASATGGALVALPAYPFWLRMWMDVNGVVTRDYSTNSVTGALGDGTWTVYDTQTPAFGPAFYVGRFADANTAGAAGGTTSCTFDLYYTNGLAGLTFAGTGTAGTTVPATVSARDNALNGSLPSPALNLSFAASTARPIPSYAAYLIGDSNTTTYRYDNASYQNYAKLLRWHIMSPLSNSDGNATQTLETICSNIRGSSIGTKNCIYFDPFFIFTFAETNFFNAFTSSNWFLRSTFPAGSIVTPNGANSRVGNLTPGGPTGPGGRTADQYVADYELDLYINGGVAGLAGGSPVANPFVDMFFHDDLQPGAGFSGGTGVTGDYERIGATNDFAYPNGVANVGIRTGSVAVLDRIQANAPYPVVVGGNGGGTPYIASLGVPPEYVRKWGEIIFENAQGGGHGSGSNPGNGGSFANMLALYQQKAGSLKTSGAVYAQFVGNNVRADGSAMVNFNTTTSAQTYSPAWQGVRYSWGCCLIGGDFDYFCCATDPFGDGGNGAPYASGASFLRWFDWFQINIATGVAYSQANANQGSNWMGAAIDAPQTVKFFNIGPTGIWRRQFANADIFLNPFGNGAQANVALGRSYRKITSAQDPSMNGGTTATVSFADGDCFIGLK